MKTLLHWKELLIFLKNPNYNQKENGIKNKLLLTFNSFILYTIITIFLIIVFLVATMVLNGLEIPNNLSQTTKSLFPPLILAGMVAILEEFSFRAFLDKFKPIYFSISITGIIAYFTKKIIFRNMFLDPEGLLMISLSAIPLFLLIFFVSRKYESELNKFWEKNFKYIFYIGAFLFAIVHFLNSPSLEISYLKTIIIQFIEVSS